MATDYIPADDAGLNDFASAFHTAISGNEADYGLVAGDTTALLSEINNFSSALSALTAAKAAQLSATTTKSTARTNLVSLLRMKSRQVQAFPDINPTLLTNLGLPVRDTTPTAVPAPTSAPILWIDTKDRLRHTIQFYDENTPNSKAKPSGVFGVEIHRKIGGDAPTSIAECQFVGLDTATPYVIDYDAAQGGVMVHYMARWATRSGLVGPSSVAYSATVVA